MRFRLLLLSFIFLSVFASAQITVEKTVTPNIKLVQTIDTQSPLLWQALIIKPSESVKMRVEFAGDKIINDSALKGRGIVSNIVSKKGAIAGINGDFFPWTGDPLGFCMRKGVILSEPSYNRSVFGWNDKGYKSIGFPRWESKIIINKASFTIGGVNRLPKDDEITIVSSITADALTTDAPLTVISITELSGQPCVGKTITGKLNSQSEANGKISIPQNGTVLLGKGKGGEFLKANYSDKKPFKYTISIENAKIWDQITDAIGGGPLLIGNSKIVLNPESENFQKSFSHTRHPRTAVGITKDGSVILLVVDGRQSFSRGASLTELAQILLKLGAVDAMNLDGGGSSTLSTYGIIINSPSDGAERPIANALVVYDNEKPAQTKSQYKLFAENNPLTLNQPNQLKVIDTINNKIFAGSKIIWHMPLGYGLLTQNGIFTPKKAGKVILKAVVDGIAVNCEFEVVEMKPDDEEVIVQPPSKVE